MTHLYSNLYGIMKKFIPNLVGESYTFQLNKSEIEGTEYFHCSVCGCKIDYCGDEIIGDIIACGDNALYSLNCIPRVYRFIEKYNDWIESRKNIIGILDEEIIL